MNSLPGAGSKVRAQRDAVQIEMLGHFRVVVGDQEINQGDWPTRRAQELIALLALSHERRLARDQVVEHLWPHLDAQAGAANLRKAAHHARKTLGDPEAIRLRAGTVELFPGRRVTCDVTRFSDQAAAALESGDRVACARAAAGWRGDLLPDLPYESWTQDPRRRTHANLVALLRQSGEWEQLLEVEPTDEAACQEVMRAAIDADQRHVAIRWYERLRIALIRELGAKPGPTIRALYEECTAGVRLDERRSFIGRETELARVIGELQRAADGGTAAVVVRGATGIGKSAFRLEIVERAADAGWRTITVTSTASGAPYGPIGSVIEQLLADGREFLQKLPDRTRSVLAELSPVAEPAPPLQGALTRHQVVAALRRALELRVVKTPTLLCLEDAHLSDEATADVLGQLVGAIGGDPLVVMLVHRAEWIRTSLPRGVTDLARNDATLLVQLGPLETKTIVELITRAAPSPVAPEVVERIAQTAQGSPFFALELAHGLAGGSTEPLPQTVREAIKGRFIGLDPAAVDVLAKLAVAGEELDLASVLALSGLQEESVFRFLDTALEAGVLVLAGTRYRFQHELVRQALTDDVPPHRRLAMHREAARRLVAAGAAPKLIAHHLLKGQRPAEAIDWLLAATRYAVGVGAFADALAEVDRMLVEAPSHHEGLCLRAEILDALGDGRAPDAYAVAATAVGAPGAQELRARQALAQLKASDPGGALRTLEGVTPTTTVGRLAEALTLSAAAAIGYYADADTAAAKAEEAHRLAVDLGDPGAILDATWATALAAHAKGELPARLREFLRATHTLPELATRVFDGQLCVTERMLRGGVPNDEIIAFADALAEEARRLGAARGHAFALTLRGEARILAGELDHADRDFTEGLRLHGQIGAVAGEALSLLGRAEVATYRGRPEHARPFLAEALVMARESEVGHHTLDRIYGAMVAAAGDPSAAVDLVREAEHGIRGPAETCPTCRIAFIVPAAIATAQAGDVERTQRYAQDCERALEVVALPPGWHAAVQEVRGWAAQACGQRQAAREHFRLAADAFDTWGQPLDAQRCAALART